MYHSGSSSSSGGSNSKYLEYSDDDSDTYGNDSVDLTAFACTSSNNNHGEDSRSHGYGSEGGVGVHNTPEGCDSYGYGDDGISFDSSISGGDTGVVGMGITPEGGDNGFNRGVDRGFNRGDDMKGVRFRYPLSSPDDAINFARPYSPVTRARPRGSGQGVLKRTCVDDMSTVDDVDAKDGLMHGQKISVKSYDAAKTCLPTVDTVQSLTSVQEMEEDVVSEDVVSEDLSISFDVLVGVIEDGEDIVVGAVGETRCVDREGGLSEGGLVGVGEVGVSRALFDSDDSSSDGSCDDSGDHESSNVRESLSQSKVPVKSSVKSPVKKLTAVTSSQSNSPFKSPVKRMTAMSSSMSLHLPSPVGMGALSRYLSQSNTPV